MKNILIFPCGSEIAREVFDSIGLNKHYKIYGGRSINDKGSFLSYDGIIENIPFVTDPDFLIKLEKILLENKIDYVFPCHDDVSLVLSSKIDDLPAKIVTHPYMVNFYSRNKDKTYELFSNSDFIPKFEFDKFPRFLKPKNSNGSRGAEKINSESQLSEYFKNYNKENTLQLEYLPGDEFTIDCFSQSGKLLFFGARKRNSSKMGIAEVSTIFYDEEIEKITNIINNSFQKLGGFNGAWFFQLKKDSSENYKLLEIGSRISGGMSFYRMMGINFPELSILSSDNISVRLQQNNIEIISFAKFFIPVFKYKKPKYDKIYVDFDDTLYIHKYNKINSDLLKFLFQELSLNKKIFLITRSQNDFMSILKKYRIDNLFDDIIHITDISKNKHDFIESGSLLIDDSFKERDFIKHEVYSFGLDNFKILID